MKIVRAVRPRREDREQEQEQSWRSFKTLLPHQRAPLSKRNWGHSWHSMCSYQGKLKPAIAHTLVRAFMPGGKQGKFLDPFAGVGTLPLEARLLGHTAFGLDISPAAAVISQAKMGKIDRDEVSQTLSDLEAWISERANLPRNEDDLARIRFNGPLTEYFHPDTLREIIAARSFFSQRPPETPASALVMASLLHILHGNRPYALSRRSHPITPFAPTGPTDYRSLMPRLRTKVAKGVDAEPTDAPEGHLFRQDATKSWPVEVSDLDAIITSPPFFDSTRFHAANWMRLWFAGWDAAQFAEEPATFIDERQKKTFAVYEPIFAQAKERLKKNGVMVIHLGKSRKCDMAAALSVVGSSYLQLVDSFSETVDHCESHGIRDKGTVTHHQYLYFRKS